VESLLSLFAGTLCDALTEWVEANREKLGEKWAKFILKETRKFRKSEKTVPGVVGFAMWAFNVVANLGVQAGLAPGEARIYEIPEWLDEKSTRRVLELCASTVSLQYLR